ncbi:hypothetical protein U1Q18_016439 [Sarracenia purpurea var. burkii]
MEISAVRFFIRYLGKTPIFKGPVIFSPKIATKSLQSALANENQLLGLSPNGNYYKTILDNGLTSCSQETRTLWRWVSRDPEYNDKSDVFSLGVILGILLTGRDPMDPFFGEAAGSVGGLGQWLGQMQQAGEAREALHKAILVLGEEVKVEGEEVLMLVRIADVCLSDLPADRPPSDELVSMLTQLHSI